MQSLSCAILGIGVYLQLDLWTVEIYIRRIYFIVCIGAWCVWSLLKCLSNWKSASWLTVLSCLVLWRNTIRGDKNLWTFQVGSAVSNTQNGIHFFGNVLAESSCLQAKYYTTDFVEAEKKGLALGDGISHLLYLPTTCIPYTLVNGVEEKLVY